MSIVILNYLSENAKRIEFDDGKVLERSKNGWCLDGTLDDCPTLFLVLSRNKMLPPNPEGEEVLLTFIENVCEAGDLSDGDLIDETVAEFNDLAISSRKDALLGEVLRRFQIAIDLDETPKGLTANGEPVWPEEI